MQYGQSSTDEELRDGCIAADRRAQAALYARYFGVLLGIPMRYTRNREEATAILNRAFLAIFQRMPHYREQGQFRAWMSTIVFRTTMDAVRDTLRQQQQMPLVEGETAPEPPTASTALATLHAEDIFRYIQQLPDDWRVVFSLYVIEGYKHEEIATLLNIPIGTSKWRLAKAKAALKTALGPIYQNEPSA